MTLSPEQRSELVTFRRDNAQKALDDGKLLFEHNSLRSAMNRTYYSMFYAVSAIAIAKGKSFHKHGQLIGYFQKEYVKAGVFERKFGRALQKAFEDRSEADYQDFLHLTEEQVQTRIEEAEEFISATIAYLDPTK